VNLIKVQFQKRIKLGIRKVTFSRMLNTEETSEYSSSGTGVQEKDYTLIFCRRVSDNGDREVLLGLKKRGFGVG
jgi:hypothetical protein